MLFFTSVTSQERYFTVFHKLHAGLYCLWRYVAYGCFCAVKIWRQRAIRQAWL